MLLKLNKGDGVTVQANHSEDTNAYCIQCYDGKKVYARELGAGNPPKSEIKEPPNSAEPIKRYAFKANSGMKEDENGYWVKYDDIGSLSCGENNTQRSAILHLAEMYRNIRFESPEVCFDYAYKYSAEIDELLLQNGIHL